MMKASNENELNLVLNHVRKFWLWVVFIFFLLSLSFSYFWTEALTFVYGKNFDFTGICSQNSIPDFKFAKILDYQKYKKTSTVNCIYKDPTKNSEVQLNFQDNKWQPISRTLINSEKGILYWPIYL